MCNLRGEWRFPAPKWANGEWQGDGAAASIAGEPMMRRPKTKRSLLKNSNIKTPNPAKNLWEAGNNLQPWEV